MLTDIDIFFTLINQLELVLQAPTGKALHHLFQLFENYSSSNLIGNTGNPVLESINNNKVLNN